MSMTVGKLHPFAPAFDDLNKTTLPVFMMRIFLSSAAWLALLLGQAKRPKDPKGKRTVNWAQINGNTDAFYHFFHLEATRQLIGKHGQRACCGKQQNQRRKKHA